MRIAAWLMFATCVQAQSTFTQRGFFETLPDGSTLIKERITALD